MFARGTRAPRCDRCGRILAPYTFCRSCSSLASAAPAAEADPIEDLIAEALPGSPPMTRLQAPARQAAVVGAPALVGEPAQRGTYDPDDFSIPREPDVFIGAGGGSRWRRMF
jgi:hypothetical protein